MKELRHIPVQKGKIYELSVVRLGTSGEGIARHEGFTVFVPFALPGEKVRAKITLVKKNYSAAELVERGVRVNAIAPGFVETEMARETWKSLRATPEKIAELEKSYPLGFGKPEQIADVVDFLLGGASSWMTGQCLVVDGGHGIVGL